MLVKSFVNKHKYSRDGRTSLIFDGRAACLKFMCKVKIAVKKKLETKHENVLGPFHLKSREMLKSTWPNISNALGKSNPRKCYILRLLKANKWRLFPSYLFSKHTIDLFLMKAFISYIMYIDSARPWTGYCLVWIIGKLLLKL